MNLSRQSLIFRWAYFFDGRAKRRSIEQTSVCAIFWRCVLLTPLLILGIVLFVAAILNLVWTHPIPVLKGLASAATIIGAIVLIANAQERRKRRREALAEAGFVETPSMLMAGAKAIKARICPIVEID